MKKTILEVYSLTVCFVTLICFAVALGVMLYQAFLLLNPELSLGSYQYEKHISNESYWEKTKPSPSKSDCGVEVTKPNDELLTKQREESLQRAIDKERRESKKSLVLALIIMLIDIIVFIPHWLIATRSRDT